MKVIGIALLVVISFWAGFDIGSSNERTKKEHAPKKENQHMIIITPDFEIEPAPEQETSDEVRL